MVFVGTGSISITNFLNSQGDTGTTMKIGLVGSAISILLSPVLIWIWSVPGLIVSIIVSGVIANVLGVYVLHRKYDVYPDLGHMGKILLCSGISAGSAYGVLWLLNTITPLQGLFIGSAIFLIVFLVLAPVTGALKEQDIVNLDSMMREINFVYPFIRLILDIEAKIIKFARAV
jgi:peptidoglycan biosynthesis protein MviN/MurJ (putative lipid II flippase)